MHTLRARWPASPDRVHSGQPRSRPGRRPRARAFGVRILGRSASSAPSEPAPAPVLAGAPAEAVPRCRSSARLGMGLPVGRHGPSAHSPAVRPLRTYGSPQRSRFVPLDVSRRNARAPRRPSGRALRCAPVGWGRPLWPRSRRPPRRRRNSTPLAGSIRSPSAVLGSVPSRIPCWRHSGPAPPSTVSRATGIPRTMPHQRAEERGPPDNAADPDSGAYG